MVSKNQNGSILTTVLIMVLALGFLAAGVFGVWSYSEGQSYKNDYKAKAKVDIDKATAQQKEQLQKEFDEQYKNPVKTYKGSVTYGSVSFDYPRTWSGLVDDTNTSTPIDGYFYPGILPSNNAKVPLALRVQLLSQDYASVVQKYTSQTKDGSITASAYIPPKMKDRANVVPGILFVGAIDKDKNGAVVVLQVRDKTLTLWTESKDFLGDFNNIVLPTLTFSP